MPKRMFLLITGALAAGLVGIVMIAGQWRQAPKPIYPVRAAPEITQLPRRARFDCGNDQGAARRRTKSIREAKTGSQRNSRQKQTYNCAASGRSRPVVVA
jgi:hypothetical protein